MQQMYRMCPMLALSHHFIIANSIMCAYDINSLPVSMLPWVLLALPNERLRWLALRNCEKDEVESIVFLRVPKALVGKRNWV